MAIFNPVQRTNAGATEAGTATTPGGDVVTWQSLPLLLIFRNAHSGSITINIAPTRLTEQTNAGEVNVPTRSLALAAGAIGTFLFRREDVGPYLNASGQIPITYTGGNAAMVLTAISV